MLTFLSRAHMVDATQCTQCNRNARVLLSPRHTVDATQCTCLPEPAHMVDATQCTCLSTRSCPTHGIFERCPSCTNLLQRVLSKKHVSTIYTDGNKAWKNECCRLGLKKQSHGKMQFVVRDKKPLKGQAHLKGAQRIDRFWQALKKYLPSQVSTKGRSIPGVSSRLLQYVHSLQFRFNNKKPCKSTGQACKES